MLAPLHDGAAVLPPLLNAMALAVLFPVYWIPTLLTGEFIRRGDNLLCFGLPGRGKTLFLAALCRELVQQLMGLAAALSAVTSVSADQVTGVKSYLVPTSTDYKIQPLLSVGEQLGAAIDGKPIEAGVDAKAAQEQRRAQARTGVLALETV